MTSATAHHDLFGQKNLPAKETWPEFQFNLPELQYPEYLNAAVEFIDNMVEKGFGDRPCILSPNSQWSYRDLQDKVNRIANILTSQLGFIPGNRVLIRSPNNPMMVAIYMAVLKAGGIVVATMPLLRAKELDYILTKAQIDLAFCDMRLIDELAQANEKNPRLRHLISFSNPAQNADPHKLETLMEAASDQFTPAPTRSDDICLIGFTSGTTGQPKGTMHFHRDLLASCDSYGKYVLQAASDDVFIGSPPLAFTFGLGGLVLFPLRIGAATYLLEQAAPDMLLEAIEKAKASVLFTAPTAYRAILAALGDGPVPASLRKCVSAGEALPLATWQAWHDKTGIKILDGIGATEMLHIFIGAPEDKIRPGSTGIPVPGYEAKVIGENGETLKPGEAGRLAVRGPTGCRYLADDRQAQYVQNGWNVTGDTYIQDEDGYFWYQARSDDMIISSGYNIAGPEVEDTLLSHASVAECGVVGAPDMDRGQIVKAYIVLNEGFIGSEGLAKELQDFVKQSISPYKYPRAIEFVTALPRTGTGKLQRFELRKQAADQSSAQDLNTQVANIQVANNNVKQQEASPSMDQNSPLEILQPAGWPKPSGYANGMASEGRIVLTGGQIGWDENQNFPPNLSGQVEQTLKNILAVMNAGGAEAQHIARMTWYVTNMQDYRNNLKELGAIYKKVMGTHYPAMALVQVVGLVEPKALVEIEALAIVPNA